MTEKIFNTILTVVIGFLACCAVYFFFTEDKTKPATSAPSTSESTTPPPTNTDHQPPQDKEQENDKQDENQEKEQNNEKDQQNDETAKPSDNLPEIVWGIDSASETTTDFYACVKENFGDPVVFGRYLGEREGISVGLSAEQVEIIHAEGDYILPIYNHFNDATGYDNGVKHATEAIKMASDLGIPEDVAIFADIEPNYPVDAKFISGWFGTIVDSPYQSGIYGVFDPEQALFAAFQEAGQNNSAILEQNYIWTAAPNEGITAESKAPEFNPSAPEGSLAWGWQYGLDAETCNIDTNLFKRELIDVLWGT